MESPPSAPRNGDYYNRPNLDEYRRVIPSDHSGPDLQVNYDETWLRLGMRVRVTRRLLPPRVVLGLPLEDRPDPNFNRIGTVQKILPSYYGEQRIGAYVKMDHYHDSFYPCHYFETELIPLEGEIGRLNLVVAPDDFGPDYEHQMSTPLGINPYLITCVQQN